MNTGFVRPAVATVPTVYGIETFTDEVQCTINTRQLQQYLPFTVLKPDPPVHDLKYSEPVVATVPTVYGI